MDGADFAYVSIYDYERFMITKQPFHMKVNVVCKDILKTEENF